MQRRYLTELFSAEAPRLRRFLRRFGPSVSAEDVAQESFAQLCAADPANVTHARGFLYHVARNLAINEHQRARRSPIRPGFDGVTAAPPDTDPGPEERLIAAERLAALQVALAGVPEHKCQALILFKIEGLSHKEIGQRLGVSHRTVERYVADALAHCHAVLRARED
jgi:RNA polymerase sigma factor (sigma-70 family)